MPNPSNSDLVGEAAVDEFYGKHSWDRLINAPDYYEKPTPLELALRDALKDAAQQLEQAEQRAAEAEEFISRQRMRQAFNQWKPFLRAALTPDEGVDPAVEKCEGYPICTCSGSRWSSPDDPHGAFGAPGMMGG